GGATGNQAALGALGLGLPPGDFLGRHVLHIYSLAHIRQGIAKLQQAAALGHFPRLFQLVGFGFGFGLRFWLGFRFRLWLGFRFGLRFFGFGFGLWFRLRLRFGGRRHFLF